MIPFCLLYIPTRGIYICCHGVLKVPPAFRRLASSFGIVSFVLAVMLPCPSYLFEYLHALGGFIFDLTY